MPHPILRTVGVAVCGLTLAVAGQALPAAGDDGAATPPVARADVDAHATDESITITADGTAVAEDQWEAPAQAAEPTDGTGLAAQAEAAQASLSSAFSLHSKPGAPRVVHLDFDGGVLLAANSWVTYGLSTLLVPGWSLDGSASFSDAEKRIILEVWARVAEDYAPFDIDVTTEEPPLGDLWRSTSNDQRYGTRVAFSTGSRIQADICNGACGGIAWIGTFDAITSGETRSPAWVFPSSLGNRAKSMAEAASHEVGHNLGLSHDGTTSSSYYGGTSLWGPLMGSPYSSGVSQWSKGDYSRADNHEDDYAVMLANGAGVRDDEAGASVETAVPLANLPGGRGYITSRSDVDWLTVEDCTRTVQVEANPASVGPNLDIKIELRSATGAVISSAAPETVRTSSGISGLAASLQSTVTPGGPYYVTVSGVGSLPGGGGTWSGGYDDYGSMGSYDLQVAGCDGGVVTPTNPTDPVPDSVVRRPGAPTAPAAASGARGGRSSLTTRWSPPASGGAPITGYVAIAYRLDRRGRIVSRVVSRVQSSTTRRLQLNLRSGRYVVRVKARNRAGWGALSARSRAVVSR
ncbi:fibronectin type III domain-containing protein [Nocardioides caeni]|uniref:Fibronectin type-III domain-containing protein n=1 Tax=Nocardioides caeni TaxID=574700 RepID=A0A4S8MZY2_9ACTN|nr:fibronectin type III domain-containing protein [Nocardioides caeni]THV09060.1 hypothetical protein E9934_17915 [Nocardioides caeni]